MEHFDRQQYVVLTVIYERFSPKARSTSRGLVSLVEPSIFLFLRTVKLFVDFIRGIHRGYLEKPRLFRTRDAGHESLLTREREREREKERVIWTEGKVESIGTCARKSVEAVAAIGS